MKLAARGSTGVPLIAQLNKVNNGPSGSPPMRLSDLSGEPCHGSMKPSAGIRLLRVAQQNCT